MGESLGGFRDLVGYYKWKKGDQSHMKVFDTTQHLCPVFQQKVKGPEVKQKMWTIITKRRGPGKGEVLCRRQFLAELHLNYRVFNNPLVPAPTCVMEASDRLNWLSQVSLLNSSTTLSTGTASSCSKGKILHNLEQVTCQTEHSNSTVPSFRSLTDALPQDLTAL